MDLQFPRSILAYQEKDVIGNGSFGQVCEYYCFTNRQICAIKRIVKQRKGAPPLNLSKIFTEISIHSKLRHPNIVRFYEWFDDPKHVYIVLELCPHGSLNQLIKKRRRPTQLPSNCSNNKEYIAPILPYDLIRSIVGQLAQGIRYLHFHEIIHRDLNLNNILVASYSDSNIVVKIADFGLAFCKFASTNTLPAFEGPVGNTICGTPGFISPEVLQQASNVSPASDLFSLGSIVYSLITGIVPKHRIVSIHRNTLP